VHVCTPPCSLSSSLAHSDASHCPTSGPFARGLRIRIPYILKLPPSRTRPSTQPPIFTCKLARRRPKQIILTDQTSTNAPMRQAVGSPAQARSAPWARERWTAVWWGRRNGQQRCCSPPGGAAAPRAQSSTQCPQAHPRTRGSCC